MLNQSKISSVKLVFNGHLWCKRKMATAELRLINLDLSILDRNDICITVIGM